MPGSSTLWSKKHSPDTTRSSAWTCRKSRFGYKGLGFKSVGEITDTPQILSNQFEFMFDAARAREAVRHQAKDLPESQRIPVYAFPFPTSGADMGDDAARIRELRADGYTTIVRLPLRPGVARADAERHLRTALSPRLLLFLDSAGDRHPANTAVPLDVQCIAMSAHGTRTEYMFVDLWEQGYQSVDLMSRDTGVEIPVGMDSDEFLRQLWTESKAPTEQERQRQGLQRRIDEWQQKLAAFSSAVVVSPYDDRGRRFMAGEEKVFRDTRWRFPDGQERIGTRDQTEHAITVKFVEEYGEKPKQLRPNTFENWRQMERPSVLGGSRWVCTVVMPDGEPQGRQADGTYLRQSGDPLALAATVLNEYGAAGWSVVESHEDKDERHFSRDNMARTETRVVAHRYLLGRPVSD
jgi:hypothetical protein